MENMERILSRLDEITALLDGADMVFITAGMGGGTGTGAAPIIAKAAKDMGILTVGVVTKPFSFEGPRRKKQAELGLSYLRRYVDSLVTVPNDKLMETCEKNTTVKEAFRMADDVLRQGVQGISDIISDEAFINTDFADVRSVMTDSGIAHMGIGYGKGEKKVTEAVTAAIESPLLETTIGGAKKMLLYILGGMNFSMFEVKEITDAIRESAGEACDIIFGANINESMEDELYVTIIATGFDEGLEAPENNKEQAKAPAEKKDEGRGLNNYDVFGRVEGLEGKEVDLQDILKKEEEEKGTSRFVIPGFLKD